MISLIKKKELTTEISHNHNLKLLASAYLLGVDLCSVLLFIIIY